MMMQQQMIQAKLEAQKQNILDKNIIPEFDVIFRANGPTGEPIMVQCKSGDKVSKIINKYRMRSADQDTSKKFIFNGFALNPDLTAVEAGLHNNATIYVVATKGIRGG